MRSTRRPAIHGEERLPWRRSLAGAAAPAALALALTLGLSGCSGDGGGAADTANAPAATQERSQQAGLNADLAFSHTRQAAPNADQTGLTGLNNGQLGATQTDAVRLAHQASFGPNEALVAEIQAQGAKPWIVAQFGLNVSRYSLGGNNAPDKNELPQDFCTLPEQRDNPNCWRDYFTAEPLLWDFYRNAVRKPDQLRQRVALAWSQLLVISNEEVDGTYGLRLYYNNLMAGAFGNYRDLLRKVALSPMMGQYLNHVNNDAAAPNENFARELLQLFTIGPCRLNTDGTLQGGQCNATYNNDTVRAYAYALTGWTYPRGGKDHWACKPEGANCQYLGGDMVPAAGTLRDTQARKLLMGVAVPAGSSADAALDKVLDSLMAHPNIGPFIGRHLILQLVSGNPSPGYVARVAKAFNAGRFEDIGSGVKGDLSATVAAVLLDKEARDESPPDGAGRLREPIQFFTGVIRAIGGDTDGAMFGSWEGDNLRQRAFHAPSVFNYYPPDFPVSGTSLVGPAFGIHNASTALNRMNYLTTMFDWGGAAPQADIPGAVGTYLKLSGWRADAGDPAKLVDRMSLLLLGQPMAEPARTKVIDAVAFFNSTNSPDDWRDLRVRRAGWLVMSSPAYQIVR